jgi:ParB-like chromosome segregation protein Spo0J
MADPIDSIRWVDASSIRANLYNPNIVQAQELALLEFSLLKTGWIQPILVSRDNLIIDGFHRWSLSLRSPKVKARYDGRVPVAVLDVDEAEAMMMTIRINRAKGTHAALKMSEIVHTLIREHGVEPAQIAQEIGATMDEVDLLNQDGIFKAKNLAKVPFSKAWVPRPPERAASKATAKAAPKR